ncbi:MAG: hypothetical protein EXR58_03760 [Chloroflexi bacterium]|nr:hypothetical protein [Chloroflexota bacterium]
MTQADEIRAYVWRAFLQPARWAGKTQVTIRAGTVQTEMGLQNALPAVCGALGSNKFEKQYEVNRVPSTGSTKGANAEFIFSFR